MFELKLHILAVLLFICHGYCQNTTGKCSITDSDCIRDFFQSLARNNASLGFAELGIPPLDPYILKNITVSALDILKLTLDEGECIGIGKTCTVLKYETDLDNMNRTIEILCDRIVLQGRYSIRTDPNFCFLLGDVHGSGFGSIVLEDWYFKFVYKFEFVKRANGQIYQEPDFETAKWISEVRKKATVRANEIMIDKRNVTECIIKYINKYWKIIFNTLAYWFHKISVDYYFYIYKIVFDKLPASVITYDDLTPYLRCNRECKES